MFDLIFVSRTQRSTGLTCGVDGMPPHQLAPKPGVALINAAHIRPELADLAGPQVLRTRGVRSRRRESSLQRSGSYQITSQFRNSFWRRLGGSLAKQTWK